TELTSGPVYVNRLRATARLMLPSGALTNSLNAPGLAPPPVVAVIFVGLSTDTEVAGIAAAPGPLPCPISTLAPAWKLKPVIVICVPPTTGPDDGLTPLTIGPVVTV